MVSTLSDQSKTVNITENHEKSPGVAIFWLLLATPGRSFFLSVIHLSPSIITNAFTIGKGENGIWQISLPRSFGGRYFLECAEDSWISRSHCGTKRRGLIKWAWSHCRNSITHYKAERQKSTPPRSGNPNRTLDDPKPHGNWPRANRREAFLFWRKPKGESNVKCHAVQSK